MHTSYVSIDEYYEKHGAKQFIRGKPSRFNFKLWYAAVSDAYLVHAEPYSGSNTKLEGNSLEKGLSVVLELINKVALKKHSTLTFSNLFTSFFLNWDSLYARLNWN